MVLSVGQTVVHGLVLRGGCRSAEADDRERQAGAGVFASSRAADLGAGRDQSIPSLCADQHQEQPGHGNRDESGEHNRADPDATSTLAGGVRTGWRSGRA
jgi:hypothetical protein